MASKERAADVRAKLDRARKLREDRHAKVVESDKAIRDLEARLKAAEEREEAERREANVAVFEKAAGTSLAALTPEQLAQLAAAARGLVGGEAAPDDGSGDAEDGGEGGNAGPQDPDAPQAGADHTRSWNSLG